MIASFDGKVLERFKVLIWQKMIWVSPTGTTAIKEQNGSSWLTQWRRGRAACRSRWAPGWTWLSWSSGWLCGHHSTRQQIQYNYFFKWNIRLLYPEFLSVVANDVRFCREKKMQWRLGSGRTWSGGTEWSNTEEASSSGPAGCTQLKRPQRGLLRRRSLDVAAVTTCNGRGGNSCRLTCHSGAQGALH